MSAAENRANDVRRQYRETEQPRRIGRNDALGFGDILERQASIRQKLIEDCVGTDEQTHKASVGSCEVRPIADDDPHLLAGALEASPVSDSMARRSNPTWGQNPPVPTAREGPQSDLRLIPFSLAYLAARL
jgi:hypothetical protein